MNQNLSVVGHSVDKLDGLSLACGTAKYTDDHEIRGALVGKILWSPHAHARIRDIDTAAAEKVPGVKCVLTHKNVPRVPHTTAGQGHPEPSPYDTFMLDNKVRFVGDRVAAVAAETEEAAEEALRKIRVEWEILPAVWDPMEAMKEGAPVLHDEPDCQRVAEPKKNIAAAFDFEWTNSEWFSEADFVLDRTYKTQWAQHCAIEPHATLAWLDEHGRIVLLTSTQVPFHTRRQVAMCLQVPVKRVRVIKPRIGGGFGSKQEMVLEDIAAMLALRTKRPVRMVYSRAETFFASRTRHPSVIRLKTGVKKDGTITDAWMEVYMNTGAYGTHGLTVTMCAGSHTLPMYKITRNIRFEGRAVYTNLPVCGAYRGYGATQGFFAWEQQMDEMAEIIGMDPLEFRLRNTIRVGETSPVFKAMGEGREGVEQYIQSCGLPEAVEKGAEAIGWKEKWRKRRGEGPLRRGVGMACMMQGSGIAEIDMGAASIKLNEDGSFNLLIGATDLGTGADTVLAQIAAEVLGVKASDIVVTAADTDITPFDVGAYASSTTYISGGATRKAAEHAAAQIREVAAKMLKEDSSDLELKDGRVVSRKTKKSVSLSEVAYTSLYYYNQKQIQGMGSHFSHSSPPPFAAHFAEVEVDTETGQVKCLAYVAAVDCGQPIHPLLCEGQTEGAVLNGISYALTEEMLFDSRGKMVNPNFTRYKIFTTRDLPKIQTILIPTYEPTGPFGAKSVAEISINGAQAAIANAIYDAIGIRLREAPFTPEKVWRAIQEAKQRGEGIFGKDGMEKKAEEEKQPRRKVLIR